MGVEKYGGPTTEGLRHHELRRVNDGELKPDDTLPVNTDVAQLRHAIDHMAEQLYNKIIIGSDVS